MWWMLLASGPLMLPLTIYQAWDGTTPYIGFGFAAGGGVLIGAYSITLTLAYRHLALALAYPVSRGIGAVLALAGGFWLLHEPVSWGGILGIGIVLLGVGLASSVATGVGSGQSSSIELRYLALPVLTGISIAGYHLVDSRGVEYLTPTTYAPVEMTTAWIVQSVWLMRSGHSKRLKEAWRLEGVRALLAGFGSFLAYVLVLYALQLSHVAIVVAARNVSLVFGAAAGVWLFGEGFAVRRLTGAVLVTLGMIVMGWQGASDESNLERPNDPKSQNALKNSPRDFSDHKRTEGINVGLGVDGVIAAANQPVTQRQSDGVVVTVLKTQP